MAKARAVQTLSRVDGIGLSVAALDMLFCALGAVMLIFAMQERVAIERTRTDQHEVKMAALQRLTEAIDDAAVVRPAQWAGVQSLPALSGAVVFVLDLSGSLASEAQRRAQRHLVTQYVLQNEIDDFAVVYFAGQVQPLVQLGTRDRSAWISDLGAETVTKYEDMVNRERLEREIRLARAGVAATDIARMRDSGILEKLGWFDVIMRENLTEVGGGTRLDDALGVAVHQAETSPTTKPTVVLLSDGQVGHSANPPYFRQPSLLDPYFESRIAISLVDPSSGGFEPGVMNMDAFVHGPAGRHVLINGYGAIPVSPALPDTPQESWTEPDFPLEGTAQ